MKKYHFKRNKKMKITNKQIKKMIKEEIGKVLTEVNEWTNKMIPLNDEYVYTYERYPGEKEMRTVIYKIYVPETPDIEYIHVSSHTGRITKDEMLKLISAPPDTSY